MKTRCIATVLAIGLCSNAFALTFIGPPTTTMQQGQWAIGARGGWSENDLELDGVEVQDAELTHILGSVHVGLVTNRMELYGLFGAGDVEDGHSDFAGGLGTKITMNLDKPLSWGLAAQAVFYQADEPFDVPDTELDAWDIQVAAGPCWRHDNLAIYGGPFLHIIRGDLDSVVDGVTVASLDVEEDSFWGAYVGLGLDLDGVEITGEVQIGPDAWGLGLAAVFKFAPPTASR